MRAATTAHVAGRVLANSRARGERTAIIFGDQRWSWETLGRRIGGWSSRLADAVPAQEVVLLFLPQVPEAIACFFGAMAAGAVPSFMPLPSAKQEPRRYWAGHRQLLALIRPAVVVAPRAHVEAIAGLCEPGTTRVLVFEDGPPDAEPTLPQEPAAEAVALLQHSSGTTGLKKGVTLGHAAIVAQVETYAATLGASADDTVVSWLPMYHDMGLIACTVMPALLGQTLVLLDPFEWVAAPSMLFEAITVHRGHWVWLPNFAFEHLRRTVPADGSRFDLRSVRAFIDCSEPCRAATFDRFATAFAPLGVQSAQLQVCYAMAETVFAVTQTPPGAPPRRLRVRGDRLAAHEVVPAPDGDVELLSCGPLLPGCVANIERRDDGCASPVLEVGEIVVSSTFLFSGYYRRPELSAQVLAHGRYRTRDLGFVHDGELYVLGRKDDLLISNGRNYFAHEIEQIANRVEGIKAGRNVALGLYNPDIGSDEVWLVQECGDADPAATRALRRSVRLAVQEQLGLTLRDVVLVPPGWLVKTTSGKISREANLGKLAGKLAERASRAAALAQERNA
jgi:fatty-acyl-CoA synthase